MKCRVLYPSLLVTSVSHLIIDVSQVTQHRITQESFALYARLQVNSFSTRRLSCCTDEYAHTTFPLTQYKQWSCELGLGFSLRATRVHTHPVYIHATCKRHVEKGLTPTSELKWIEFNFCRLELLLSSNLLLE